MKTSYSYRNPPHLNWFCQYSRSPNNTIPNTLFSKVCPTKNWVIQESWVHSLNSLEPLEKKKKKKFYLSHYNLDGHSPASWSTTLRSLSTLYALQRRVTLFIFILFYLFICSLTVIAWLCVASILNVMLSYKVTKFLFMCSLCVSFLQFICAVWIETVKTTPLWTSS